MMKEDPDDQVRVILDLGDERYWLVHNLSWEKQFYNYFREAAAYYLDYSSSEGREISEESDADDVVSDNSNRE